MKWNNAATPILQLGPEFYDPVEPALFPEKKLRYWNDQIKLDIDQDRLWDFKPLVNNLVEPLALRYHGHQFQHYNPDLGDGRGFLYAQIRKETQWYDLGTKGSGQTPYSRRGDGRLTLKGAVRESLATEMLESLGVKTSKTLCFYETGEKLIRGDEPSPTRSAVLTRFTLGHIRIGTFQRLAFYKQSENIKKLISYCLNFYYADDLKKMDTTDELALASQFLKLVVSANARLVAQVMMAGFVHGVLNSDNINISGELFDFGPYRFLPEYDPQFTAAYFDEQGLYCFGRQPSAFLWNLHQLAESLKVAHPDLETEPILESFAIEFNQSIHTQFLKRLNLKSNHDIDTGELVGLFFSLVEDHKLPFEQSFFDFNSLKVLNSKKLQSKYLTYGKNFTELCEFLKKFQVADQTVANHAYFKNEKPTTLLIDEIETLWAAIAENDDWNPYNEKLQSIRVLRGLFTT
ncbi:MAG: YdiU family protein [Bdellovibrionaceae bacterium]|nr:YdiU family protein [Bdellovibrio sp.]